MVEGEKFPALVSEVFRVDVNTISYLNVMQSEKWVEKRSVSKYQPILLKNGSLQENFDDEEWLASAESFNRDLEWMLELTFHR
ncbi:MAG: hypothetical protein ACRDAX_00890 [Propionibacteriaceae bacterium]